MKFLDNYQEHTYAMFRIVTGFLFVWHGTVKYFDFPTAYKYDLSPLTYAAGGIEMIGGALVMIGLFTRPAAFICSGTMAVAYWMVHGMNSFWPIINNGELAVFFCFAFLFIAARGVGMWGFDKSS